MESHISRRPWTLEGISTSRPPIVQPAQCGLAVHGAVRTAKSVLSVQYSLSLLHCIGGAGYTALTVRTVENIWNCSMQTKRGTKNE